MAYGTGEALALTRVQACTGFDATNTSRSDWKILNSGKSDHYAILRPGSFSIEWMSYTNYIAIYTTVVELWQIYGTDDATTLTNLYSQQSNLMAIMAYPLLGDTTGAIQDAGYRGANDPENMWQKGAEGPTWVKWEMFIDWKEEVEVTFAE